MKKIENKNKIIIGGLITLGICSLAFITKPTYKTIDNDNLDKEKMAVYIKNETGNYEKSNIIPTSGYILDESKSTCNNDAIPSWNYKTSTLKIKNLTKENTSCYLYFDSAAETVNTVLGNLTVNKYTPDFSQVATTDEGIFKAQDNDGTSYYWRGATEDNYLKFGGYCWRVIRINGDGTVRLIYDGKTCHTNGSSTTESIAVENVAYNTNYNRSEYVGWTYTEGLQRPTNNNEGTSSNAKVELEKWYNEHLVSYNNKIADGKFCNNRNVGTGGNSIDWSTDGTGFYYVSYTNALKSNFSFKCSNDDIYNIKVGLITLDEAMMAGGRFENSSSYYLYNGQDYWTMSPFWWSAAFSDMFRISGDGIFNNQVKLDNGLRPVINLHSDITISSGDGSISNPYIVAD